MSLRTLDFSQTQAYKIPRTIGLLLGVGTLFVVTGCQSVSGKTQLKVGESVHLTDTYPNLPPAKDMIRLKEKQTLKPEGLPISVSFDQVLSDDRCPYNAQCIWAGNATVSMTVTNNDGKAERINLSSGDLRGDLKRKTTVFGHSISLETIYPTPSTNTSLQDLKGLYMIDVKVVPAG